jgi:hypothetical protein
MADQTYTKEQLDAAVKLAVAQADYQGTIERRLANLENMTKKANNLKTDIIDLIHKVDDSQRARIQMILDTVSNHASLPGHPLGVARLDELEDNLTRFGFEAVGDEDALQLPEVLAAAADTKKRLAKVERKSVLVAMNSNRVLAATAAMGFIIGTISLIHQLWR